MRIRYNRAPATYRDLNYISTGASATSYIDIGYTCQSNNIEIEIIATTTKANTEMCLIGAGSNLEIGYSSTANRIIAWSSGLTVLDYADLSNLYNGTPHRFYFKQDSSGRIFQFDDYTPKTNTQQTVLLGKKLYILSYDRTSYTLKQGKLYKVIIKDNDIIVSYLVPAVNLSNNNVGMYDLVQNIFFASAVNDQPFIAGENANFACKPAPNTAHQYEQLTYLESTNSQNNHQYINIDVRMKSTISVDMTLLPTQQNKDERFLGAYDNGIYIGQLSSKWRYGPSCSYNDLAIDYNNPTRIIAKTNTWTFNDTTLTKSALGNNNQSILLFAASYRNDTPYGYGACKLYECKIYDSDTLIRDFIPARRKSDNVLGLYDNIEHRFFTNDGNGTFLAGEVSARNRIDDVTYIPLRPVIPKWDYQQIEYIQSTGTQYINTGYYWHSEVTKIDATFTVITNSSAASLWGSEEYQSSSTSSRYFAGIPYGSNGSYTWYLGNTGQASIQAPIGTKTHWVVYTTSNKTYTAIKDDVVVTDARSYSGTCQTHTADFTSDSKGLFYLFANHNSGKTTNYNPTQKVQSLRLYRFKMYDNDILVRDFVPCYRKSDNKAGLYDTVNNQFYIDSYGGNFTKGNDVANTDIPFIIL